ncbi:MAG TPA: hypothetical protein PLL20_20700 [Phycisphaerae bacterium]|nr:hypothetical protein [Phycisphaerae bacterium]
MIKRAEKWAFACVVLAAAPVQALCPPGFTCDCKVTTPWVPAGSAWGTVHNPSFESGFTSGVGNNWTGTYGHFVSAPTFSDSTVRATNGTHSQRIDIPECAQYYTSQRAGIYQQIYVIPGQNYTVSADVYMQIDQGESYSGENMVANVGLDPYGDTNIHEGSVKWSAAQGDKNAWRTLTVSTTAVFEVMTVYVNAMRKWPGFGNGRIWIDNVVISGPIPTSPPSPPEEEPPDPDADVPETTGGELVNNGSFEGSWSNGLASGWSPWSTAGTGYWKQSTRIGKVGAGKYDYGEADTVVNMNPKTALTMQMGDADYWGSRPNMIDTVIVGRLYIDHLMGTYLTNPTYYGRVHADNCWIEQQYHPRIDCWQGSNEPGWGDAEWANVLAFEKAFAERCHELGMKAVTLNISVGSPGNIWKMLEARDSLAVSDYVGYHSYGGPNDQLMINNATYDPPCDYALRWRKYVHMYRDRGWRMPPVIYTEGTTYHGWHGVFQASQIRDDLIAFGAYMNEDRWCTGLTLFVAGGTGVWENWNIRGAGDIATACGTWNANNPSEATAGLYSQQFGAGQVHPTTLSEMQNPNAAFTGGIRQQITGLSAGNMYLLDLDFRYEFRGFQPQVSFHTGIDLTGQTSNPNAASINWSSDIIAEENAVHEVWERTWRTFTATGSTASIWIMAHQAVSNPAYRISVDRVSVKQVAAPPTAPAISLSPTTLSPSCTQGSNASNQTFTVTNSGIGTLSYTISDNQAWLSCTPTSGTSAGEADTITVSYSTSGLSAGTYNATITVSDPNASNNPQTIAVTLTVNPPATTVSEDFETMPSWSSSFDGSWGSAATWSIVAGGQSGNALQASRGSQGSSVKAKVYGVTANTNYIVSVYVKCPSFGGTYWCETACKLGSNTAEDFDNNSGTWTMIKKFANDGTNGNGNTWTQYNVALNTGSNTQITLGHKLGSYGGAGPTVQWDTMRIVPEGAAPSISRSPATLSPSCTEGSNASNQTFTVANNGLGVLNYSISDNVSWLSCSPTSGTSTGEQDTITVTYLTSGLSAGTYYGTITVSDPNASNSPQTIAVTLTVNPSKITVAEDFNSVPSWSSSYDAPWGGAASWSSVTGGQSGDCLQATRSNTGSSSKVKVYNISPNASYTLSIYMRCPSSTSSYWRECFYKLGSNTAQNFDSDPGSWTEIKKFSNTGTNGNGDTWVQYTKTFNSGSNTQISVGFKTGNSSGTAPTMKWDTLRIQ